MYKACFNKLIYSLSKLPGYVERNRYLALARLHRPVPLILLFAPIWWTLRASNMPILSAIAWGVLLLLGAIAMRSAGCVINDIWDQDFDKKVQRTKLRPIAAGLIKNKEALLLLSLFLSIALLLFLLLPLQSKVIALIALLMTCIYPLTKRFLITPQVFLGFTYNLGILLTWYINHQSLSVIPICLYISAICWTIGYDCIYGLQDKDDDINIGIHSMSIALGHYFKPFVLRLYMITSIFIAIVGLNIGMNLLFYFLVGLGAYLLYWQIERLDEYNNKDIASKFNSNAYYALIITAAFILG